MSALVTASAVLFGSGAPRRRPHLRAGRAALLRPDRPGGLPAAVPQRLLHRAGPQHADGQAGPVRGLAMPANVLGVPIDPAGWNRQDGFSPGSPILARVPGLDAARTRIAPVTDVARSLAPDAPIVLLDARTGRRTPYWAELDAHAAGNPDRQALIIRPAVALTEGTRYVVGLRGMRDGDGVLIPAPTAFRAYVTGAGLDRRDPAPQMKGDPRRPDPGRRQAAQPLPRLGLHSRQPAGADRADAGGPGRRVRRAGRRAPSFTVTQVTDYTPEQDPLIARQVTGTVAVPSYLTGDGGPGSRLHYGPTGGDGTPPTPNALPTPSGTTVAADFVCNIPRSARRETRAPLALRPRPARPADRDQRRQRQDHVADVRLHLLRDELDRHGRRRRPVRRGCLHRPQRLPRGGRPAPAELPELPVPGPDDDPPQRVRRPPGVPRCRRAAADRRGRRAALRRQQPGRHQRRRAHRHRPGLDPLGARRARDELPTLLQRSVDFARSRPSWTATTRTGSTSSSSSACCRCCGTGPRPTGTPST
ncbi:hypothetical protein V2I01_32220 [Micromonospora sp. BRA006-A]|nr:hypothetical protein [Micromonospora sp. BRA006-A]